MTRYARAKGSKASNERLPNEGTPWCIMKQQLVERLNDRQENIQKVKSAKELLDEKEESQNGKSSWAEFEETKPKKTEKPSLVYQETDSVNNKNEEEKLNRVNRDEVKMFSKTQGKTIKDSNAETGNNNITDIESKRQAKNKKKHDIDNDTKSMVNNVKAESIGTINSTSKKISKKCKQEIDTAEESNRINKSEDKKLKIDLSQNTNEGNKNVKSIQILTKRQKRNIKSKTSKMQQNCNMGNGNWKQSFDVPGNDWNNSLKFGRYDRTEGNSDNPDSRNINENSPLYPQKDNRFANDPRNFADNSYEYNGKPFQARKVHKRKPSKIRDDKEHKRRKPDMAPTKIMINGVEVEIVPFDGFPVQKHDAERLKELKQKMIMKGIPKSEIDAAMKLERRKAEKALTRIKKNVCFHCRKAGHNLVDCPELANEQSGTGICFKCGSTEHTHFECKVNRSSEYRYATCFICREQGHIAKQCPDNPKGVYPQGGACKVCGDVTHLKKDCPELAKGREESALTVDKITGNTESLEHDTIKRDRNKDSKSVKKIIQF